MTQFPEIIINSSIANYSVIFRQDDNLQNWEPNSTYFLIDDFFKNKIDFANEDNIFWINANEDSKSFIKLNQIFISLKEFGCNRKSSITAIGGGVVQDIATIVSSLYMRGIKWNYIPTTFLGMTDSCLGGKSSINVGPYKNLIGNFHPPNNIEILPSFAKTLPKTELFAGIAESAKICFCAGNSSFEKYLEYSSPLLSEEWSNKDLLKLLHHTLNIKKWFIEKDEFDIAERKLLNYGHTWGHALESATNFSVPHGLAIAIGILASILFKQNITSHKKLYKHCFQLIIPVLNKKDIKIFEEAKFITAFNSDKKHSLSYYHLITPKDCLDHALGVEELRVKRTTENLDKIVDSMKQTLNLIKGKI